MRTFILTLTALLAFGSVTLAQKSRLRPTEIGADHVGQNVSVEGRVYTVNKSKAGMHLYFGADTSSAFQALIPSGSVYKFKVDIQKKYSSRNVRVTGEVEEESGKYFIRIEEPKQLKVVPRRRGTS